MKNNSLVLNQEQQARMNKNSFWDMDVEEVMGANVCIPPSGHTPPCNSDTPNQYCDDTYYSRSNIAQLSIHEESAEELIAKHRAKAPSCSQSSLIEHSPVNKCNQGV